MAIIKWAPLYEPLYDFERLISDFHKQAFMPAVDMYEKSGAVVVEVAIAGISPENIKINIDDTILTIEGSSENRTEVDETNYYRKEVRSGSFHRLINLPYTVDANATSAEYEKGMLKITMPKIEESKTKPVQINIKK